MGSVQNFFTSRDNNTDPATYVGQLDRLWYNPVTNSIFVSDGNTAGGVPVALATGANITANIVTLKTLTATSGNITVTGNLVISGNISPASNVKIGGIKAGPGVDIANDGTLTIDSANLPLSFGDFTASNNVLTIVNVDEDMILQTQGSAEIQLVGNIGFYKPDGIPPNTANRYFQASDDGQITMLVPTVDSDAAVKIIGSTTGNYITPGLTGAMLHITGQLDVPSRAYYDGNGDYVAWVARRWNGNVAAPTQVLANEDVLRINSTAASNVGVGNVAMAQIAFTALENQTTAAQGSQITFTVTPVGSPASARVAVANVTVANGVTATKFTTAGTVSATGNITGGNIITGGLVSVTGNVTAGNVNSYVTLPAGTTGVSPLVFTTGSITNTASPGAFNYDGRIFYATPQNQERGLVKTAQTYILNADYPLTNQSTIQSMFGVSVGLSTNTRYVYTINIVVYKSANNITMSYASSGNVVLARHSYQSISTASATLATLSTPSVLRNILTTGFDTPVTVTAALNGIGYYSLQITGLLNVSTAGLWTPLLAFSGLPGAGSFVSVSSAVEVYPVGIGNAVVSIGNWA